MRAGERLREQGSFARSRPDSDNVRDGAAVGGSRKNTSRAPFGLGYIQRLKAVSAGDGLLVRIGCIGLKMPTEQAK